MKKAALITIYQVPNFGSVLQAFATQQIIEKLGWHCDIIRYCYPNEWHISKGAVRKPKLYSRIAELLQIGVNPRFRRRLELFRRKYFHFTKPFMNLNELEKGEWSKYDVLIAGSDQLWNVKYTQGDKAFLLSFAPKGVRCISIASSCASDFISDKYVDIFKKELSKFFSISVRDNNTKKALVEQLGVSIPVHIIPDPTLLFSAKDWLSTFNLLGKKSKVEPYILFYRLDYAFQEKDFIPYSYEVLRYFSKKTGIKKIMAISGYAPTITSGVKMEQVGYVNPIRFVELFSNAALVITSSFHGTAFALNFSKPLVSIVPSDIGADDRQISLLNDMGLEHCVASLKMPMQNINPYYDTVNVQKTLSSLRKDAIDWISINL